MYAGGLGTEQDDVAAAEWFSKAAAQNHKYAQYSLAGLYSPDDHEEQTQQMQ